MIMKSEKTTWFKRRKWRNERAVCLNAVCGKWGILLCVCTQRRWSLRRVKHTHHLKPHEYERMNGLPLVLYLTLLLDSGEYREVNTLSTPTWKCPARCASAPCSVCVRVRHMSVHVFTQCSPPFLLQSMFLSTPSTSTMSCGGTLDPAPRQEHTIRSSGNFSVHCLVGCCHFLPHSPRWLFFFLGSRKGSVELLWLTGALVFPGAECQISDCSIWNCII